MHVSTTLQNRKSPFVSQSHSLSISIESFFFFSTFKQILYMYFFIESFFFLFDIFFSFPSSLFSLSFDFGSVSSSILPLFITLYFCISSSLFFACLLAPSLHLFFICCLLSSFSLTVILFLPSSVFKTLFLHPVPWCDHFTCSIPFLVSCVYYYLYSLVPRVIILTVFSTPPPSPFSGIYMNSQGHSVSNISFPSPFLLSADWACLTMKILGLSCPSNMSGE